MSCLFVLTSYILSDYFTTWNKETMFTVEQTYFQCEKCFKTYKFKNHWKRHVRVECGKEPKEQCPYCNLRTYYKFNLLKHIKRAHKLPC